MTIPPGTIVAARARFSSNTIAGGPDFGIGLQSTERPGMLLITSRQPPDSGGENCLL